MVGGYAQRRIGGRAYYVHRIAYCDSRGVSLDSIAGQVVRHTCDNARCVNPDHLLLGTHQDNMDDKAKRNRVTCTKLTPAQVMEIRATCVPIPRGGKLGAEARAVSQSGLAKKFGVGPNAVRQVYLNLSFKHL